MLQYAQQKAPTRSKRTAMSPALDGDDSRPDRDLVAIICEICWYQWHYGDWHEHMRVFANEIIGYGRTDCGEDDVGFDIKGTYLQPGRTVDRMHLLVKAAKFDGSIRYVAAFYDVRRQSVCLAGYMRGYEILKRFPEVTKVKADGFHNYVVPVKLLHNLNRLPHAVAK